MWDEARLAAWWKGEQKDSNTYQEWRLTRRVLIGDIFIVHTVNGNIVHSVYWEV